MPTCGFDEVVFLKFFAWHVALKSVKSPLNFDSFYGWLHTMPKSTFQIM